MFAKKSFISNFLPFNFLFHYFYSISNWDKCFLQVYCAIRSWNVFVMKTVPYFTDDLIIIILYALPILLAISNVITCRNKQEIIVRNVRDEYRVTMPTVLKYIGWYRIFGKNERILSLLIIECSAEKDDNTLIMMRIKIYIF